VAVQGDKAGTAVGRGRLSDDLKTFKDFKVIFRQEPKLSVGNHFGSRLVFDRDGYLFITLGENNDRPTAQDLDKLQGKIVRIYPDGKVPDDNPFVGQSGVRPEIWAYGLRNPQGAALNPWTGTLWENEHGLGAVTRSTSSNAARITAGRWRPMASIIPANRSRKPRVKPPKAPSEPRHVWEKSPGVSGMAFYDGDRFKAVAAQRALSVRW
jgi:glucose/arabinose dehydrogenase